MTKLSLKRVMKTKKKKKFSREHFFLVSFSRQQLVKFLPLTQQLSTLSASELDFEDSWIFILNIFRPKAGSFLEVIGLHPVIQHWCATLSGTELPS